MSIFVFISINNYFYLKMLYKYIKILYIINKIILNDIYFRVLNKKFV